MGGAADPVVFEADGLGLELLGETLSLVGGADEAVGGEGVAPDEGDGVYEYGVFGLLEEAGFDLEGGGAVGGHEAAGEDEVADAELVGEGAGKADG